MKKDFCNNRRLGTLYIKSKDSPDLQKNERKVNLAQQMFQMMNEGKKLGQK